MLYLNKCHFYSNYSLHSEILTKDSLNSFNFCVQRLLFFQQSHQFYSHLFFGLNSKHLDFLKVNILEIQRILHCLCLWTCECGGIKLSDGSKISGRAPYHPIIPIHTLLLRNSVLIGLYELNACTKLHISIQ